MKKNFYKAFVASSAMAMILGMSACQDDDIVNDAPVNNNVEEEKELDDEDYQEYVATPDPEDELTVSAPTSMMGLSPEMEELMGRRFVNRANGFDADVIIVDAQMLYGNPDEAKQAYEAGKVIIEVNVVGQEHIDFWNSLDVTTLLDKDCKASIVALHNGDHYKFEEVDEMVNSYLNPLVRWTNKGIEHNQALKDGTTDKIAGTRAGEETSSAGMVLSNYLDRGEFTQTYTNVQTIHIKDYEICKVFLSDPDKITRPATTVEAHVTLTPIHVFHENNVPGAGGDYYFVTVNVTSHNKPLYDTYKNWHGAVCTYAHAFYCTKVNFDAYLTGEGIGNNVRFFQTPTPTTTSNSTKYDEGFTKTLNVSGQGGYNQKNGWNAGVTVAGTFTWTNTSSVTVSDQSIEQWTEYNGAKVHYSFKNNNFKEEDETDKAIPAIARNDQSCKASWCWQVTDAKDDANNDYNFFLWFNTYIGYEWRHATWTCEGSSKEVGRYGAQCTFTINHPNRDRRGVLNFISDCSDSKVITGMKVYQLEASGEYKLLIFDAGTIKIEKNKEWTLPIGKYKIEYSLKDRDDIFSPATTFYIDQIDIQTGKHTDIYSVNGKKLE